MKPIEICLPEYSHLFNKPGGWNKSGGGARVAKSLNVEVVIKVEDGIFWKKLVHNSNKRGVEGGKIEKINKRGGWIFCFVEGGIFQNR